VSKIKSFAEAINEALHQSMSRDNNVFVIGLGVPDPKSIFGTTKGLTEKFGTNRVLDMPTSENAMTGIVIGAALRGMRPILTHQRVDFAFTSMEQIVNQAAKWHYMFNGKASVPLVIRMVIGRGWGQGPQHSQSPQSLFAHVNGLKVIMPSMPGDAKNLLLASIYDDNPVIYLEHRWLYNIKGPVEETPAIEKLGKARVIRKGSDISIIASSHMVIESLRAAEYLAEDDISAEVIDLRIISPLDSETILTSVRKTGRIIVVDGAPKSFGIGAECIARISEEAFADLKAKPERIALPDHPVPASPALASLVYPGPTDIATSAATICEKPKSYSPHPTNIPSDVPDNDYTGPF